MPHTLAGKQIAIRIHSLIKELWRDASSSNEHRHYWQTALDLQSFLRGDAFHPVRTGREWIAYAEGVLASARQQRDAANAKSPDALPYSFNRRRGDL